MKLFGSKLTLKMLLSYAFLIIVPFAISTLALSYTSSHNIHTNTLSYINLFVKQISSNIDSYIGELDRMTRISILDPVLCDTLSEPENTSNTSRYTTSSYLQTEVLKMMTQQPSIINVIFVGINGMIYYGNSNSITNIPLFNEITHTNNIATTEERFYISRAHIPHYLLLDPSHKNEPVFTITRILRTYQNETIGAVVLTISCQDLLDAINADPKFLENGARIVITNQNDEIVTDTSSDFSGKNVEGASNFKFTASDIDKDDMQFSSRTSTLTTSVIIDKDQLFKSTRDFNRFVIILFLPLLLIILFLSAYFSHRLIKPVKQLDSASREYAQGNYAIRTPVTSSDEIGHLCSSFNIMASQIQELMEKVYHYQLATKQAQLDALQNQINPHFLYNTLDSIRMNALINHDRETAAMIHTLSRLFRITLDRSSTVTIANEMEHTEIYLSIQNIRFSNRYHLTSEIPKELLSCSIIKLIFQPLVENCIKHGFKGIVCNAEIYISAVAIQNDIIIRISDNGIGIPPDKLSELQKDLSDSIAPHASGTSIGIRNIRERIHLEYGAPYYLKILANPSGGTTVEIRIPKHIQKGTTHNADI